MEWIKSTKNPRVKEWKKLLAKKGREQSGMYLIEGEHLVEEAIREEGTVLELIAVEGLDLPRIAQDLDLPMTWVSAEVAAVISSTETPQGFFAVCKKEARMVDPAKHRKLLFLDGVQDPGNLGTLIRTADAAGIDGIVLGEGTVDLYNPKVIRSAQGSHFHLPVVSGNLSLWVDQCKEYEIPVYGTALKNAVSYKDVEASDAFALIVGNEGAGMQPELLSRTDRNLYIPIYGKSESLNVAIAAGILLYHLRK